jgi:hypothetical protein
MKSSFEPVVVVVRDRVRHGTCRLCQGLPGQFHAQGLKVDFFKEREIAVRDAWNFAA